MTSSKLFGGKVIRRNATICFLLLFFVFSVSLSASAEYSSLRRANVLLSSEVTKHLAFGVTLTRYNEYLISGFNQFSVLKIDLEDSHINVSTYLANDLLTVPATLSNITKSNGLIASVNADFFDVSYTNSPLSTLIQEGNIIRSPRNDSDFSSIVLSGDASAIMRQLSFSGTVYGPRGIKLTISGYNENSVAFDSSTIFDLHWPLGEHKTSSASWLSYSNTTIVVVDKNGYVMSVKKGPIAEKDLIKSNDSVGMTIGDENNRPVSYLAYPCYEIVARGKDAVEAAKLFIGDKVEIEFGITSDIANIMTAFSGKPVLVTDGVKTANLKTAYSSIQGNTKAQRTAAGISADGKYLYLVVVDGRLSNTSGMTLDELADLMLSLGCYNALNLDGGGSSSLVYNEPSTNTYRIGSRLSESERRLPYAVGVAYSSEQYKSGVPVSISFEMGIKKKGSEIIPVDISGAFDRAISGGFSAFTVSEIYVEDGNELIIEVIAKDALGQEVQLGQESGYYVDWTIDGGSSNIYFSDNNIIRFNPKRAGKYVINVSLISENAESFNLPSHSLAVRSLGKAAYIQMMDFDQKVSGFGAYPLNISIFDSYGFLIPTDQRNVVAMLVFEDGSAIELDNAIIPSDVFLSEGSANLIIWYGNIYLICHVKVEGNFKDDIFIPSRIKVTSPNIKTTAQKGAPTAKSKIDISDYASGQALSLNVTKGGITSTDPSQWNSLRDFLHSPMYKELVIILEGGTVLNTKRELSGFLNSNEAKLFLELLSWYSDGENLKITVIQKTEGEEGSIMYNGIKFLWESNVYDN